MLVIFIVLCDFGADSQQHNRPGRVSGYVTYELQFNQHNNHEPIVSAGRQPFRRNKRRNNHLVSVLVMPGTLYIDKNKHMNQSALFPVFQIHTLGISILMLKRGLQLKAQS